MNIRLFSICVCVILLWGCSSKKNRYKTKQKQEAIKTYSSQVTQSDKTNKTQTLVATSRVKVTEALVREYINQHKHIAMAQMQRHKIPASIILSQAILESGVGQGTLARKAQNHFGIKCHKGWQGDSVRHDDDELDECFRKYDQVEASFEDHSLFLTTRERYKALFSLKGDDYKAWARGLKKAGYATDPKYADKLIALIERYQLHQYDRMVLGNDQKSTQTASVQRPNTRVKANKSITHKVAQGDTLYNIAKRYRLPVKTLMLLNKLTDTTIKLGQVLIVSP